MWGSASFWGFISDCPSVLGALSAQLSAMTLIFSDVSWDEGTPIQLSVIDVRNEIKV